MRILPFHIIYVTKAVSTLTLAIHELATNSTKYGALSSENGSVTISWTIEPSEEPMLRFHWSEMGGPIVIPPSRRGFGSRIIERTVGAELSGKAEIDFRGDGVKYELFAPISALTDDVDPYSGRPASS